MRMIIFTSIAALRGTERWNNGDFDYNADHADDYFLIDSLRGTERHAGECGGA